MTGADIVEIEAKFGIRVPNEYRQIVSSASVRKTAGWFQNKQETISINERNRQMSWLGRPLDRTFFIFGADQDGRELFMDLDIPGTAIMVADHGRKSGTTLAVSFQIWVFKQCPVSD